MKRFDIPELNIKVTADRVTDRGAPLVRLQVELTQSPEALSVFLAGMASGIASQLPQGDTEEVMCIRKWFEDVGSYLKSL